MRSLVLLVFVLATLLVATEAPAAGGQVGAECSCSASWAFGSCQIAGPCPCTCYCRLWGRCRCVCDGAQIVNPPGD